MERQLLAMQIAGEAALAEQQKYGAPTDDRAKRVEAAGKGRVLVIAIWLQWHFHGQLTTVPLGHFNGHGRADGHFPVKGLLQFQQKWLARHYIPQIRSNA